jgi:hypothetical protein
MCRVIRDLTPQIAITLWLFVALPLIYLNGGPDEMIEKIPILLRPSMEIRNVASIFSVIVAFGAAALAWEAIRRQTRTQKWLANHLACSRFWESTSTRSLGMA